MGRKTYTVVAPLVQAKLKSGAYVHLYKDGVLPEDVDETALSSMLDGKMVVESAKADEDDPAPQEMTAGGDPGEFNAAAVLAYLATADDDERTRVLEAEAAGKNRKGVISFEPTPPAGS